jgi:hypothetical protein
MKALLRSIPLTSVIATPSCMLISLRTVARRGFRRPEVSNQRSPIFKTPFCSHQGPASKSTQYGQGQHGRISHQLKLKSWLRSALRDKYNQKIRVEFAFREFVSTLIASGLTTISL